MTSHCKIYENIFDVSVTEAEITEGVLKEQSEPENSCLCILRNISDIGKHFTNDKAFRFVDMKSDVPGPDEEAQHLLKELKERRIVEKFSTHNLIKVDIEWDISGASISLDHITNLANMGDAQVSKHKEYLDNVCADVFNKVSAMIQDSGTKQSGTYDEMTTEVLQHFHFAKLRCEVFEGRGDTIKKVFDYFDNDSKLPFVVYGKSGCGKTSIMAKVLDDIHSWSKDRIEAEYQIIVRFLGTTAFTSNLHQLLFSVCHQLCHIYEQKWHDVEKFSDLVRRFLDLCSCASSTKPLVVIFDSIDQLMPAYNAYKMTWLPEILPSYVKIVVSSIDEGYDIVRSLREKYEHFGGNFVPVVPLGEKVGLTVIHRWLRTTCRKVTKKQEDILKMALEKCSMPLYARIVFDHTRKWHSYDTPSVDDLEINIKGAINKLFDQMEEKFGGHLVKHSLAYLTASRYGLSEVELEHLLSLDDELLNRVYQYWKPPVRRIPPLLWTRIRNEISSYLVERSADDILVICWYHRQFIETTRTRYLSNSQFSARIHTNMADFFLGTWGGGKAKPFQYSQSQIKRFGIQSTHCQEDRQVPLQPYMFELEKNGCKDYRFNKRKLTELPYQLHKSNQIDRLKTEVFFNFHWLFAKLKSVSCQSIIEEFEIFMQVERVLRKDIYMRLMYATFKLIQPYISKFPDSLAYELSGRLSKFVGKSKHISQLVQQCDTYGVMFCPFTPVATCFEAADLGLKQIINIRPSEPWTSMGAVVCTSDFKTVYVIDYDEQLQPVLASFDIESGEQLHQANIQKDKPDYLIDVYFQIFLDAKETSIIALCRRKYQTDKYSDEGCVDIIRPSDALVIKSFVGSLFKRDFSSPVEFISENYISVRFGWKFPLFHMYSDIKRTLGKAHLLFENEKMHALIFRRKNKIKEYVSVENEDDAVMGSCGSSVVYLRTYPGKEDMGLLEASEGANALVVTNTDPRTRLFISVGNRGTIQGYKVHKYGPGKVLKPFVTMLLPRTETFKLAMTNEQKRKDNDEEQGEGNQAMGVTLIISKTDDYLLAVYQGSQEWDAPQEWEAFLWHIPMASGKFVGKIVEKQGLTLHYPSFSGDGQYVVFACSSNKIHIVSTKDCKKVNEYKMLHKIRDFYVSTSTSQAAVMMGKDISIINVGHKSKDENSMRGCKAGQLNTVSCEDDIIPKEFTQTGDVNKAISMIETNEALYFKEKEDIDHSGIRHDQTNKGKICTMSWISNDGHTAVLLFSSVQVIDTTQGCIKYSPDVGDTLTRTVIDTTSENNKTETIVIPDPDSPPPSFQSLTLSANDKIVNQMNRVKYRVTADKTSKNSISLMLTSSKFVVMSFEKNSVVPQCTIYGYQETVNCISSAYLVTHKKGNTDDYVKLYSIHSGQNVSTYQICGLLGHATLSADNSTLYTVSKLLTVQIFSCDSTLGKEVKIHLDNSEKLIFSIKDIISFPRDKNSMLVKYASSTVDGFGTGIYVHVDICQKKLSAEMTMRPCFEDISDKYGIDSSLNVYNILEGKIAFRIPYREQETSFHVSVKICQNNDLIVFVDKQNDTLHMFRLNNLSADHLASCSAHSPSLPAMNGISIRLNQSIICLRNKKLVLVAIRFPADDHQSKRDASSVKYTSESKRAVQYIVHKEPSEQKT